MTPRVLTSGGQCTIPSPGSENSPAYSLAAVVTSALGEGYILQVEVGL